METLFSKEFQWLWMFVLGVALFFPARKLIWVMSVRRAERREGPTDAPRRQALKRRATVTAALLCFIFSVVYVNQLFSQMP